MYHVYMIECADGSLYTGVAADITRRLREHYYRLPRCARYTRSHPMTGLKGLWETEDKVTAYRLEYRIKQLDRKAKDRLLADPREVYRLPGIPDEAVRWVEEERQADLFFRVKAEDPG